MASLPPSPPGIRALAGITVLQVLVVLVLALVDMFGPDGGFRDLGLHLFWLLVMVIAILTSWQLLRARAWARSVLVTWHLLLIFSFLTIARITGPTAVVAVASSVVAVALFLLPSSREFIQDRRSEIFDD